MDFRLRARDTRRAFSRRLLQLRFQGSAEYWERRYGIGGTSGPGSYGDFADFKAQFLNDFVARRSIADVIEFGCGDGHQLSLASYPRYIGLDVAQTAIELCSQRFATDDSKSFFLYSPRHFVDPVGVFTAELGLSLDVIFHLVEDDVCDHYLRHLFGAASRFVVIYSTDNTRRDLAKHVRHRHFTDRVTTVVPHWELVDNQRNKVDPAAAQFFVYAPTNR